MVANDYDTSDILGGQLHIQPAWKRSGFWFQLSSYAVVAIIALAAFLHTRVWYLKWKEERHRLSLRRKYGIPDNDHRPFNVAWAAVQRAQRETHLANQATPLEKRPQQTSATAEQQLRHRPVNQDNSRTNNAIPTWAAPHTHDSPSFMAPNSSRASSHRPPSIIYTQNVPFPAHSAYDSSTLDTDDASMPSRRTSPSHKRGSKRVYHDEEDDDLPVRHQSRDKRARNISLDSVEPIEVDEDIEDDEELMDDMEVSQDEVDDLPDFRPRGKKRDRAEAGSTFGGDDSGDEEEAKEKSSRRKRRTVNGKRKSEVHSRGTKRDRDTEQDEETEDDKTSKKSRKKRGKRSSIMDHTGSSDISMDDAQISNDPLCNGRKIGEEWEANGTFFKVGPNGDRLRLELVKKATSRYSMPKDSVHPDSQANVEVFVEAWLTEDEYQDAKARRALAWQESVPAQVPSTPTDSQNAPSTPKGGKNLIWSSNPVRIARAPSDSSAVSALATLPRRTLRQSLVSNSGASQLRPNPFHELPETPTRRISSVGLADSTNNTPDSVIASPLRPGFNNRGYSKWEKQELEAATMKKIRSKLEEAKKKKEAATAPPSAPAAPAATTTFAKPADPVPAKGTPTNTPAAPAASPFSFAAPAASAPAAPAKDGSTKPPATPATTTPSPFPSLAAPAPVAPTPTPSAVPNFFAKPAAPAADKPASAAAPSTLSSNATPAAQPSPSGFSFAPAPKPAAPPLAPTASTPAVAFPTSTTPSATASSPSLLSRIGTQPATTSATTPAQPSSAFSFAKPATTAFPAPTPASAPAPAAATPAATTAPKFNFGFGAPDASKAPVAPSTPAAPPAAPAAAETPKPAATAEGSAPKFSFGAPAAKPSTTATPLALTPAQETKPPTFGATAFSGTPSAFGAQTASASNPVSTGFAFANAAKPIDSNAQKSPFNFTPSPAPAPTTEPPKPAFSFSAAPTPAPAPASEASKPAFSFTAPTPGAGTPTSATSTPAFSFGAKPTPTPTSSASFTFGAPAPGAATPASGATTSAFGTTSFNFAKPTSFTFGQEK